MVYRLRGRLLAALATALLAGWLLTPTPAPAADPDKSGTALNLVPADAAFFTASLHNKEQLDAVLKSNAYAKVRAMPAVKEAVEKFQTEWKKEKGDLAPLREFIEAPDNKDLVALLADAGGSEIFVYGGAGWIELLELYSAYNRSSYNALLDLLDGNPNADKAQVYYMLRTLAEHPDLIKAPELTIGFKIKDPKLAEGQIARLELLVGLLAMNEPAVKEAVKREKVAGTEFLTVTVDSATLPWPKTPFKDFERKPGEFNALETTLKGQKVTVGLGVKDGYLLLTFGPSVAHVAKLGAKGPKLAEVKELAPLAKHADKTLTSVSYSSRKFNEKAAKAGNAMALSVLGDPDALADFGAEAIKKAKVPDAKKKQLQQDLDELVKDLKKNVPQIGAYLSFEFMSSRGLEGFSYDYSEHPRLDGSKPLTLLQHVGGNPILATVARSKSSPENWDLLVKWIKIAYGYADELAQDNLQGNDKEKYNDIMKSLLPLAKRFDDVTRKEWIPALADGQLGFVLDAKWSSKQWFNQVPETPKAMPLPEFAVILGVSDAELLKKAVSDYRDILNALLALASEKSPDGNKVPELKVPPAESAKAAAGTLYFYSIPKEAGLDAQVLPTAGLSKNVAAFSLSKAHTTRLLAAKPLKITEGPLAEMSKKPLIGAIYFDHVALIDAATPWVELAVTEGVKSQMPDAKEKDVENYLKQTRTVLEVLKCLQGYSSATYLESGATVTHSETVFKDLAK